MTAGIRLQRTLSRPVLGASNEQQLLYVLLEATPEGLPIQAAQLPLNLCLLIDRSSSMRGERLQQVKDATAKIVDQLHQDDFFALITFNDRAEVVVPSQRATHKVELKRAINAIEAAGGTELATGMALAVQEIQRAMLPRSVSRLLLLTDGRTYGDEARCVEITRRAQGRNIGVTALGIGLEWNEDLLETMTARENSRAQYITSASDITQVFNDELQRMHSIFAQRVTLNLALRPGGVLRSVSRVRPFIATIAMVEEADQRWNGSLGDWPGSDSHAFLLEIVVPALEVGDQPLLKLALKYDLPGAGLRDQVAEEIVRVTVQPADQVGYEVEPAVKHWLERLVAYRLQSSAWQDLEAGRIEEATKRLQMAGTRLFEAGERELAKTVQEEATRLLRSGATSDEGRKRIRFGTRGLIGRSGDETPG